MSEPDEFVTLLRSSDAPYVDQVIAVLEAEGIPCQHPGKNHAAMLPGFTYIEIHLRVPRSRYEDARALLGEIRPESSSKIAFRVRRERPFVGAVFGLFFGMFGAAVTAVVSVRAPQNNWLPLAVLGAGACCGFALGKWPRGRHCSIPTCGRRVTRTDAKCSKCGAAFRGTIQSDADHFAAVEAFEELDKSREPAGPD